MSLMIPEKLKASIWCPLLRGAFSDHTLCSKKHVACISIPAQSIFYWHSPFSFYLLGSLGEGPASSEGLLGSRGGGRGLLPPAQHSPNRCYR